MDTFFLPQGLHGIWDIHGVAAEKLSDEQAILLSLHQAAQVVGARVLQSHVHHFGCNMGVTGVLLLAESHISIHTWPEHGYGALDIFMCGQIDLQAALVPLEAYFQPQHSHWQILERGIQKA